VPAWAQKRRRLGRPAVRLTVPWDIIGPIMGATVLASPALFYAFTLGMLAAVNPCAFPLLLVYLELLCGWDPASRAGARAAKAVSGAALSTVGFLIVFGTIGLAAEAGWSAISDNAYSWARVLMACVGIAMVVLGVASVSGAAPAVSHFTFRRHRRAGMLFFGISYAVGSLGCSLPLFISGVSSAFSAKSLATGTAVFISYGLGMGCVLAAVAVSVALAGRSASRRFRRISRLVPWIGGSLLVVEGVYLSWYWIAAIADPSGSIPPQRWVTSVQQAVSDFLDTHARVVGAVLGTFLVVTLLALGLLGRSRNQSRPDRGSDDKPGSRPAVSLIRQP